MNSLLFLKSSQFADDVCTPTLIPEWFMHITRPVHKVCIKTKELFKIPLEQTCSKIDSS